MNSAKPVVVRLTEPAAADLRMLMRKDPQVARWCVKKMLLLERSPLAGEALLGGLVGYRRLVVGNRDWRIVWRVLTDTAGTVCVDVAEVWAAGARADAQVYQEMVDRLATLGPSPRTTALSEVVATFGRLFADIYPAPDPVEREPVPQWLAERLVSTVGLDDDEVAAMTPEEALAHLEAYWASWRPNEPRA